MRFTVKAPASSANLGPGFDAIGIALDLWNTVAIDTDGPTGEIVNLGSEAGMLEGHRNLTVHAMETLAREHDRELPPFAMIACTEVPVSRGLGSSAAALVAGNSMSRRFGQSPQELFAAAAAGEAHARDITDALCRVMGRMLYNLVATLDLQRISLGGSVFWHNRDFLLPRLQAQVEGHLPPLTRGVLLVAAGLGDRVGDYAALALLD